jgi:hypothetical protein
MHEQPSHIGHEDESGDPYDRDTYALTRPAINRVLAAFDAEIPSLDSGYARGVLEGVRDGIAQMFPCNARAAADARRQE